MAAVSAGQTRQPAKSEFEGVPEARVPFLWKPLVCPDWRGPPHHEEQSALFKVTRLKCYSSLKTYFSQQNLN